MTRRVLLLLAMLAVGARASAAESDEIPVGLNANLELIGAAELLTSSTQAPAGFVRHDVPFERDASRRLAALASSPAVRLAAAFDPSFDYYTRADVITRFSSAPALEPRLVVPDMFIQRAGGRDALDGWIAALRAFSLDPAFAAYRAEEDAALEGPLAAFRASVHEADYRGKIESYTGLRFDGEYYVLLSPYLKAGGQVNSVVLKDDGRYEIQSLVGPEQSGSALDFRPEEFPGTAWHELAHGLLDTLADLNRAEIEANAPLEKTLPWTCYGGDWVQCVKEHVVRAVMIRLIARNYGEAAAARRLQEEGEKRFPYLKPMIERLREYEADRKRYPTLVDFYPRLLSVFPAPSAAPQAPAAETPGDPGPEWASQTVRPFSTPGQLARALRYLNKAAVLSPALRLKRAAVEYLAGSDASALADAQAVLSTQPRDPRAALIGAESARRLGRDARAEELLRAALAACPAADEDEEIACRNARGLSSSTVPEAPTSSAVPAPRAAPPDVSFRIDPRIELLSVAAMLADPKEFAEQFPGGESAYARDARRSFARMAGHPFVARLAKVIAHGSRPNLPAELMLYLSTTSALSPDPRIDARGFEDEFGGPADFDAYLSELRDFAVRSGFDRFYARHAADYAAFEAEARRESALQLDPAWAEAYLRAPFASRYRFLLAPLLPGRFGANVVLKNADGIEHLRMRSSTYDRQRAQFDFNSFGGGVAHELIHTITDPLAAAYSDEIGVYAGLETKGCTDSWPGCVREQVVFAVTLRILALHAGAEAYRRKLDDSVRRGFPQLPALCDRLKEYEASAAPVAFASFYPRLIDVFRAQLIGSIRARAEAATAPPSTAAGLDADALTPTSPVAPVVADTVVSSTPEAAGHAALVFEVDPRVELYSLLRALAAAEPTAKGDGYRARALRRFASFRGDPAVAEAAAIEAQRPQPGLVAQLLSALSPPPRLDLEADIPGAVVRQAGGRRRVLKFFELVRAFARRSGFAEFYADSRPDYRRFISEASSETLRTADAAAAEEYLGVPFRGRFAFALAALLPGRSETLMVVDGRDGDALRLRSAARDDGESFGLDSFGDSATHELIHTVTNPLVAAYGGATRPPPGCNDRQGGSWSGCVQEHLVYAVELRLLARDLGERVYRQTAQQYERKGFPYLSALGDRLKEYEADRKRYPTIVDFYPRLAEIFLKSLPAEDASPGNALTRAAKDRGVAAFMAGRTAQAEKEFSAALKADPRDVEALLDLGVAQEKEGRSREALNSYSRAVDVGARFRPREWEFIVSALSSRAALLAAEGNVRRAREDLKRALDLAPADWPGRADLAAQLARLPPER